MFRKNLVGAIIFISILWGIYTLSVAIGLPLYPWGMLLFLLPIVALVPIYQYFESQQIKGYKQNLLSKGLFKPEELALMTPKEIEMQWRLSRQNDTSHSGHSMTP
jgi:hypothetical protein